METDGDRGAVEAMIPLSKLPLRDGNYGPHVEVIVSGETFETSSEGWKRRQSDTWRMGMPPFETSSEGWKPTLGCKDLRDLPLSKLPLRDGNTCALRRMS